MQARCLAWWGDYKAFIRGKIAARCKDLMPPPKRRFPFLGR